jgi:hypothetical protein
MGHCHSAADNGDNTDEPGQSAGRENNGIRGKGNDD